ncbi:ABC transporter ATP-binding protein [Candidatus Bathyarchaeota archaeon]|nr:ABC transporter ATP-binding protein [Candidatus Bathyarchaeota archaeon]
MPDPTSASLAVDARNVRKLYGGFAALNGISFQVGPGEVFGLIGPNGAGKTTCLRIVSTLIRPTFGSVTVFGLDVVPREAEVRRMISYLPEEAGAYRNFSGREYLEFIASFYASNKVERREMVNEAFDVTGLGDRLRNRVGTYSKGMTRRLLIARALAVKPRLAILDEPTGGLDVIHAFHIRNTIKDYVSRFGISVLLSSHNMLEVEYLCKRIALIDGGRIVAEGSPEELKTRFGSKNMEEVFMKATGHE